MSTEYMPLKFCLLGATFSTSNMGVSALTSGIIKSILYHHPNAEIILLDYGKERITYEFHTKKRKIPIQLINMRFSKKIYLKNNIVVLLLIALFAKLIPFQSMKERIIYNNFYLNHIYETNVVVSIAGGDSFSDIYGIRRFLYVSLPQLLVLLLGKELILLPQTHGPFNGKIVRKIAKFILNNSRKIYSRDYTGLKEIEKFLKIKDDSEKIHFSYDVGFVLDPVKPDNLDLGDFFQKNEEALCVIGLNVSGLLYKGGYSGKNMFGLKIDYRDLIYDIIDFLMKKEKVIVLLIPHTFGTEINTESDLVVCEKIYSTLKDKCNGRLFIARGSYDQNEIKYIIGFCDFFIGSRMHACIAALSQNIPAVAIAYSKKFLGVFQTIGVEYLVTDPRVMRKKEIMQVISDAFEQRAKMSKILGQKMPLVKETVLDLFNERNIFS